MKKLKVYIFAYAKNNLGDDIFLKILVEKYPDINFYINIEQEKYMTLLHKYPNVTIIKAKNKDFDKINPGSYDAVINIGGSIFIENTSAIERIKEFKEFILKCNQIKIPFFYVSSNFGPYQTQQYLDLTKQTLSLATDVCFREKYSYELFKKNPNARWAPDLIFSFDYPKQEKEKNTLGISIIHLKNRQLKEEQEYYKVIANHIKRYQEKGNKIYLFSFCEYEQDEEGVKEVEKYLEQEEKKKLTVMTYQGDVNSFLESYSKMEKMICTRFHSMILSAMMQQKFYVISYSKKLEHVIEDLSLCEKYSKIEELTEDFLIEEQDFKQLPEEKIEILKRKAQEQLQKFDEWKNLQKR